MTWPEMFQTLEHSFWEAEQALDGDVWEQPAASWVPPKVTLAPPSAPEDARLQELSSRCELLRRRLEAAMGDMSSPRAVTRRLQEGAHGYLMTHNLRPSR